MRLPTFGIVSLRSTRLWKWMPDVRSGMTNGSRNRRPHPDSGFLRLNGRLQNDKTRYSKFVSIKARLVIEWFDYPAKVALKLPEVKK